MKSTIDLLRESQALLEGHFLLSSGRHSDKYFQCAKLFQYPDKARDAFSEVVFKLKDDFANRKIKIDLVAGPAMGGIIAAYEIARQIARPAIFTERDDNGNMTLRRGFEIKPGQNVLIVEDVVTTGKSSRECAQALENAGAVISGLVCLVDRRADESDEIPWPFYPALRVSAENWDAETCELCKKGIPVIKPGSRKI